MENRGIKRKFNSEWNNDDLYNEDNKHNIYSINKPHYNNDDFWKQYIYNLDAYIYEEFECYTYITSKANPEYWIHEFIRVPKCFIIKYHDLIHPKILNHMYESNLLTNEEYNLCTYTMGYPSKIYFP
jgi:hypothetical protein